MYETSEFQYQIHGNSAVYMVEMRSHFGASCMCLVACSPGSNFFDKKVLKLRLAAFNAPSHSSITEINGMDSGNKS